MFYRDISMVDFVHRNRFTYFDEFVTGNMILDDGFHLIIHGCRKSIGLLYMFELSSNPLDIADESHIKHPINLI